MWAGRFATERTYVEFEGQTAYGERRGIPVPRDAAPTGRKATGCSPAS